MRDARRTALAALFALCLLAPGLRAAEPWVALEQPDLRDRILSAGVLAENNVGIPVFTTRFSGPTYVPNPDGKTVDALWLYFKNYSGPYTAVILDLGSGEMKQMNLPYGHQFKNRTLGPDGKLYMLSTDHKSGLFLRVYDPAANDLSEPRQITEGLIGETNPLVIGTDGVIYGAGSYAGDIRKAGLFQIAPADGKVTVYGPVGPAQDGACWGYSVAADDQFVYVASGKIPWYLVAYDRRTGKSATLLETARQGAHLHVFQGRLGCWAFAARDYNGGSYADRANFKKLDVYWLHEGKAIPAEDAGGHPFHPPKGAPPWPDAKDVKPWVVMPPMPEVFAAWADPDRAGRAEFWYRFAADREAAMKKLAAERAAGAEAKPADAAPPAPESLGWRVFRYFVPVHECRRITGLIELPDGRLFGRTDAYMGNFIYDPKTYTFDWLGKLHLSEYCAVVHEGKVYMSGYPSSVLYRYDPARPWTSQKITTFGGRSLSDTDANANPRQIAVLRTEAGAHKMWAAAAGAGGKLYFCGRWYRDGNCGGLGWWDTKQETMGGFWKPFACYRTHFLAAAEGGRYMVVSTEAIADQFEKKPKPEQAALFVVDTATDQIVKTIEPVPRAASTGPIAGVGGSRVMGITPDPDDLGATILYGVDVADGKVHFRKKLPFALDWRTRHLAHGGEQFDFRLGPDGFIWTFCGPALVRINPVNAEVLPVGDARVGGRIAFSGDDVFLSGEDSLRCEPGLLARLRAGQ